VTDTSSPIAATLIHPSISGGSSSTPDFDLFLYDPAGNQVSSATTRRRQDELGFRPTVIGTYKLRVRSYAGSGAYFLDASAPASAQDTTPPAAPSAYRDAILRTSGLSSYWRLGETTGTTAKDAKGTNDGTYGGGVKLGDSGALTSDGDRAVGFDGQDDVVDLDAAKFGTPSSVSVEAWVKLGASGKIQTLATNAADEGNNGFTLSTDTGSRPQFLLAESSTTKAQPTASTQMAVGTWYHVVGTRRRQRSGANLRQRLPRA